MLEYLHAKDPQAPPSHSAPPGTPSPEILTHEALLVLDLEFKGKKKSKYCPFSFVALKDEVCWEAGEEFALQGSMGQCLQAGTSTLGSKKALHDSTVAVLPLIRRRDVDPLSRDSWTVVVSRQWSDKPWVVSPLARSGRVLGAAPVLGDQKPWDLVQDVRLNCWQVQLRALLPLSYCRRKGLGPSAGAQHHLHKQQSIPWWACAKCPPSAKAL